MAESLGQKLRQAREEKDISISEVAEQTRISALYLESIENDDYRSLPGGIFNKGFVKSFAKYVGLDEHEALEDYAKLMSSQDGEAASEKSNEYRPEVLTDDSRGGSMLPNVIIAVLILGLMAWGVFALVKYVQSTESASAGDTSLENSNIKEPESADETNSNSNTANNAKFDTDSIKLKVSYTGTEELSITSTADGKTQSLQLNSDIKETIIEGDDAVKIRYYKGANEFVVLELNGKKIKTPQPPATLRSLGFEYEFNMNNLEATLKAGELQAGADPATENANTANANTNAQ